MEISKELQNKNKDELFVSYDFNKLNPSAQIGLNNTWLRKETAYQLKKSMKESICSLLLNGRWNGLKSSAFLSVKNHNPEKLFFSTSPLKKNTAYKKID